MGQDLNVLTEDGRAQLRGRYISFVFQSFQLLSYYLTALECGTRTPRYSRFDRDDKGGGQMFFSEKPDFTPTILPGTQD